MAAEHVGSPRLQERDYRLLSDLSETLLIDTETIQSRYFPDDKTGKAMLRRMRLLSAAELIEPIPVSVAYGSLTSRSVIYRLTPHGADVLAFRRGSPPARLPRTDLPKAATLVHRTGDARLMLTVNDACEREGLTRPRWLLESDTVPGAA